MRTYEGKQRDESRAIGLSKEVKQDTDLSGTFRHRGSEFLDWTRSAWHFGMTPRRPGKGEGDAM